VNPPIALKYTSHLALSPKYLFGRSGMGVFAFALGLRLVAEDATRLTSSDEGFEV
jgi:hypothetical protein